jgi:hypothetical protein
VNPVARKFSLANNEVRVGELVTAAWFSSSKSSQARDESDDEDDRKRRIS